MTIMYCELCKRPVEARRRIGPWTWLWGILSVGISTLAIPFYSKRCPICETKEVSRIAPEDVPKLRLRPKREELEQQLDSALEELDSTSSDLERTRAERDFYKELSDHDAHGGD